MKVGFIGLGKLGRDAAEVLKEMHELDGYDPKVKLEFSATLEKTCQNKDIVLIAVQTPHDPEYGGEKPTSHLDPKDFDYTFLKNAVRDVDELVDKGTLISVISTVLPGTVRREILPLISNGKFIYNPYLIAQGTVKWDMKNPEMIMIGTENGKEDESVNILKKLYGPILENKNTRYEIGTWEEIESLKVFYNTFITAKLVLVNMIQDVAIKVGNINVDVITNALKNSTQRIMGPSYMRAGFGDGGACHPRDNIALRYMSDKFDLGYDLFDSIMIAREAQAKNMAEVCIKYGLDVVILGKAFKPGIDQTIGSPSMLVGHFIESLSKKIKVFYDKAPDNKTPYVYLVHNNTIEYTFNKHSIVIDPYRSMSKIEDIKVVHYGNTRIAE